MADVPRVVPLLREQDNSMGPAKASQFIGGNKTAIAYVEVSGGLEIE
jgi:hypothetical protein